MSITTKSGGGRACRDKKPRRTWIPQFIHIGFDGKRTGTETYIIKLRCVPAALSGRGGDEYTCREFQLKMNAYTIRHILMRLVSKEEFEKKVPAPSLGML